LGALSLIRNLRTLFGSASFARRLNPEPRRSASHQAKLSHRIVVATLSIVVCLACGVERGTVGAKFGRDNDGHLYVRDAPPGLGADKAGIREGDEVILIDGRDPRPLSDDAVHVLLSGERGTAVRFTLLRGDEVLRVSVQRTPPPSPAPTK
jgi:S1-C subfamily serine protease